MEIYNKLYDFISDFKKIDKNSIETIIKYVNYPENLKNILLKNLDLSLKILNRYNNITKSYIEDDKTLDNLFEFLNKKLVTKNNTIEKEEYILFDDIIYNFLIEQDFFQKCYDELGISIAEITKEDIIEYKKENPLQIEGMEKLNWRKNQIEAIEHVKKYGITTGIHCQATGCGKTFIILKYIDFIYKLNPNSKIILFTERVSILSDLFDFKRRSNPADSDNIKFWKEKDICDLTQFNIIDRVTVKKSDWVEQLNNSNKPTLLVINRAYLTLTSNYKNIKNLSLILHDECHNVSSNKCFEFLKYIKNKNLTNIEISESKKNKKSKSKLNKLDNNSKDNESSIKESFIPIVGFSATPFRAGKTKSGENTILNKNRLLEIYGINNNLNLITNYNMIYAISSDLILPPRFYWFDIENYQTKNSKNKENIIESQISKPELGSVMKILDEIIPLMPNKKFVAWCGTISLCDEWYDKFNEHKDMYPNLKNLKLFKDNSKKNNNSKILGYNDFKNIQSEGIMFCAQKHREGSDIIKLDGCIFLDKVKNRGAIPFIQSIGRVLRKEASKNSQKTCGVVIDGVVRDNEDYEKNIVDKILGYYFSLNDIANLDDNKLGESNYDKYVKLIDLVKFDSDEKIIKLKLDKITIEINCKKLDWKNIIKNFDSILEKKINLNPDEVLRIEFEKLKKIASKIKIKTNELNLVNSWKKKAMKKNLPIKLDEIYFKFWKGWYDFYDIDKIKFIKTKKEWKNKCLKLGLNVNNYKENICNYLDLPELPEEIYEDFKNLKIELEENKINNLIL